MNDIDQLKLLPAAQVRKNLFKLYQASGPTKVIFLMTDVPTEFFLLPISNLKKLIRDVLSVASLTIGPFNYSFNYKGIQIEAGLWDSIEKILQLNNISIDDPDQETPIIWLDAGTNTHKLKHWYEHTVDLNQQYHEVILSIVKYWSDYFNPSLFYCFLYLMASQRRARQQNRIKKYNDEITSINERINEIKACCTINKENYPITTENHNESYATLLRDWELFLGATVASKEYSEHAEILHLRVDYGPEGDLSSLAEAIYLAYPAPSKLQSNKIIEWPLKTHMRFVLTDLPELIV